MKGLITTALAAALLSSAAATPRSGDDLLIDPLLIAQATDVWSIIARRDNPIWPGWNAADTPLLIYLPNKQDVLLNHPKPPEGFREYHGPQRFPSGKIMIKDGPTLIGLDGQNTSYEVNGVLTLVVADTLSTRRQNIEGIVDYAKGGGDAEQAINDGLMPDPYAEMAMFAHEAFHVYQGRRAPDKGANELSLCQYPSLSVQNNVELALEGQALKEALTAKEPAEVRKAAVGWLALRQDRRESLPDGMADYEDGAEFLEGTAKYVEYRLFQVLQGRKPGEAMWWNQGFHGYDRMDEERLALLNQMCHMTDGSATVNNDLYGASPVRFRLYFSGMAIAALLDALHASWHDAIFAKGVSLTSLASEAIKATPAELAGALQEVKATAEYTSLLAQKQKLAADGEAYIKKAVSDVEQAPSRLVIDYSAANAQPQMAFTPFGILRVDADRSIFRLVPISGRAGGVKFVQQAAQPVLQDRAAKTLEMPLGGAVTESMLDNGAPGWRGGPVDLRALELPGLTLSGGKAVLSLQSGVLTVKVAS